MGEGHRVSVTWAGIVIAVEKCHRQAATGAQGNRTPLGTDLGPARRRVYGGSVGAGGVETLHSEGHDPQTCSADRLRGLVGNGVVDLTELERRRSGGRRRRGAQREDRRRSDDHPCSQTSVLDDLPSTHARVLEGIAR